MKNKVLTLLSKVENIFDIDLEITVFDKSVKYTDVCDEVNEIEIIDNDDENIYLNDVRITLVELNYLLTNNNPVDIY